MFKKQNFPVPEKQTTFTEEQILHDIEAIRKSAQENSEKSSSDTEGWYSELKDFNNVSNNLVGALDDGGDIRDQLQILEKELRKFNTQIRQDIEKTLRNTE